MDKQSTWSVVELARDPRRLTCMDYIENVFHHFFELHGDRLFGDDPSVITGMAYLDDQPVMIIGQNRGRPGRDAVARNYGMAQPEGYRKAQRVAELAEKFGLPLITLVDTPGAYMDVESEYRGQASAIATSISRMLNFHIPILSVIIGQGGSGGALALAVADQVFMLGNATYSILSPEGFATILYKDVKRAKEAAENMKMTAADLLELEVIDGVIEEAPEGNWTDPERTYRSMEEMLKQALAYYSTCTYDEIIRMRKYRFRIY